MIESIESNRRIVKNTLILYIRMILVTAVNIYTVRVVWDVLGVDDYGVYNVVGGIVMMFAFLNSAMVAASQRFISFELGYGDKERLRRVFNISLTVHILLAIAILLLAETIGLWFLNERLNIPESRMIAANWVYQCSIISFMVNIVSVPYNSCIVAHEHMKVFGYFGILDAFLKLFIVFLLVIIPFDKLIIYSVMIATVSIIMRYLYRLYCTCNFEECKYKYTNDHHMFRDMFYFAGWSFIGNLGFSLRDQGLNVMLNIFFNVTVNGAKGVANQIAGAVTGVTSNFQMAITPQITKRYATGEVDSMVNLVFRGCKYSALLMMLIVVPLYIAGEQVLNLWLVDVAPFTLGFLKIVLVIILVDSMVGPITAALQAVGNIRVFQIVIFIIMTLSLPIAWVWLRNDADPYVVQFVTLITSVVALAARIKLLNNQIGVSYFEFLHKVIARVVSTLAACSILSWVLYGLCPQSIYGLVLFFLLSVVSTFVISFILGLSTGERTYVLQWVRSRLSR